MCFKQQWVGHFVSTRRSDLEQEYANMDEFHVHKMYRNLKKGGVAVWGGPKQHCININLKHICRYVTYVTSIIYINIYIHL